LLIGQYAIPTAMNSRPTNPVIRSIDYHVRVTPVMAKQIDELLIARHCVDRAELLRRLLSIGIDAEVAAAARAS
jgi:hypothetical protein